VILHAVMAIWTQADIDTLKAAVASGVLTVSYAGPPARSQTYQSLDAMRSLLAEMVRQVTQPTTFRHAAFRKGFDRRNANG
jgi:hypothetical protein